jgi:hypothetical protein
VIGAIDRVDRVSDDPRLPTDALVDVYDAAIEVDVFPVERVHLTRARPRTRAP